MIENSKFNVSEIDLLNIDIQVKDLDALKSLNIIKHNPKIIIIETRCIKINDIIKSDICLYLITKEYSLKSWYFYSLIFVKKDSKVIRNR